MQYVKTSHDTPVFLANEDAVFQANQCAADLTNLSKRLVEGAQSGASPSDVIKLSREIYQAAFDAFIYGVDYGRKNPNE